MRRMNMKVFFFSFLFIITLTSFTYSQRIEKTGKASWYANSFQGKTTASGEKYSHNKLTAAHKTLPFGTVVKVINISNGRSVKVRINDRGPYIKGRIIDLSKKAAEKLGITKRGVAKVRIVYNE